MIASESRKPVKILPKSANMSPTIDNTKASTNKAPPRVLNSSDSNENSTSNGNAQSRPTHNDLADFSCKGEYLQQLSTSALPPYRSPLPSLKRTLDVNCCLDCGDSFTLKSSLTFHLERRSILIKFPCDACEVTKIFYNRCALLSHIRSHTDSNESADIKRAVVNPLPRVLLDGLHVEFGNALDDELNNMDDSNAAVPSDLLEFSLKEVEEESTTITPNTSRVPKVKCLDCNEEFESAEARKKHLTNDDKIPLTTSQCNTCGMLCPSKCHLKAHQRLHLQVSPYVCPECGDSPDYYWANFQHHVKYRCFHNARSIGYKCPACKRVSPSNDSLLKHMELHTEKYLKCLDCVRAYTTMAKFDEHVKDNHPGRSTVVKHSTIYKCSLCDIVFLTHDQMLMHRSTHLKNQVCEYVFNCMQCGKNLENKVLLLEHIKLSHAKLFRHITQNEATNKPMQPTNTFRGRVECILCNTTSHSFQGYCVHVNRAHININQTCNYCYMIIGNRKEMVSHGQKHLKKGHVICLLCNNKKCDVEKNLEMHLKYHVDKLQGCSACPICNELMPTTRAALEHLRMEHLLDQNTSTSSGSTRPGANDIICHFCRIVFAQDEDLQEHLRTKHSFEQPKQPINLAAFQQTETQAVQRPRVEGGGSACAKCDFQSDDRKAFKEHLLTHKENASTFQCQECGVCFVVEPALAKHLRIMHRISDPKKYLEEEGSNFLPPDAAGKATEAPSCDSLICSVCFKTFATETALKTHMRSHGMAFIQANKSSAAAS